MSLSSARDCAIAKQGRIANTADKYYAKRENEPAIYELDAKAAQDLIKGAADIKQSAPPKKK